MRHILGYILILFSTATLAQVKAEKTKFDFGDIYSGSPTYVDFVFTNHTDKNQYLLTIDKPRDVYYIFSAKTMQPDSSIVIRFKVNDQQRGRFSHVVDVYFSEPRTPITVSLTGNIKEVAGNPMTACPDFNSNPTITKPTTFGLTIKVIDSLTREPINKSEVFLVERGELVGAHYTNSKGIVHKNYPLGYYFITVQKEGYESNFTEAYVNFQRNYVEIELSRKAQLEEELVVQNEEETEVVEEEEIVIVEHEEEIVEEEVIETEETIDIVEIESEPVDDTPLEELPDTLFDNAHFKFNNITFILDVSSSMNSSGKLDLLKLAMLELVQILRPEDQVTLIKYASEVTTLMAHASGERKEEITEIVEGLRTSGLTAGGDAIKEAYRLNKKGYIPNGNNIVIMVTDGAFNKGDNNYLKTIANNYEQRGIRFSVVGIQTSKYLTTHMNEIVEKGGGAYIQIRSVEDARKKLIGEIRRTSFKS